MHSEVIDLQPGPQRVAAESDADIIFFGGSKGCGKTVWLEHMGMRWYDLAGHSSLIFRRTYPELTGDGSIWEDTSKLYPLLGGVPVESKLRWTFPSGKTVSLRHLQHAKDAYAYNGKNIGDLLLDELSFFEEEQFWILLSCQRSSVGGYAARPRVFATMNPDPDSWVLQFVEWYLDEAGYPIAERSGVVRWFGRRDGKLVWFDSREAAIAGGITQPKSFTFVAAKIWDNPALLALRPEYLANLQALPPVEQARYLGGNWRIRAQAGDYFREEWFPIRGPGPLSWQLNGHPSDENLIKLFRVWDLAGTPWQGDTFETGTPARHEGDEPDWTRGGLFGLARDGRLVLLDMASWRDSPGAIERAMIATHLADGPRVVCVVGHDPGQAGTYQIEALEKAMREKARVREFVALRATAGKEEYAAVAARIAYRGRLLVQRAPWNRTFFRELEAFPAKAAKKDQVDVVSQGVQYALGCPGSLVGLEGVGISRGQRTLNLDLRTIGDVEI